MDNNGRGSRAIVMENTFDTAQVLRSKLRAAALSADGADFLMRRVADDLKDRMAAIGRTFETAVLVHCITGDAEQAVLGSGKARETLRIESDPVLLDGRGLVADAESVPLAPESIDLAVSVLTLQDTNDTPGKLIQIRRALKPDGLFMGAMAGTGTLGELRECLIAAETELAGGASPRVHPFADVRAAGSLLQRAGFALPVTDLETYTVRYDSLFDLMRDLRAMGVTNALVQRSRKPARRALFLRAAQLYAERFADPDGRIRATFSIVWMSGWAPHESQQKPLKPGTPAIPLADALKGHEPG